MINNKVFLITQVSLVADGQLSLFGSRFEDTVQGRNQLYRDIFYQIIEKRKIVSKARVMDNVLLFNKQLSNDLLYFQLAKQKKKEINALIEDEIKPITMDDFPPIDIFVNLKLQQILIEIKESVFELNEAIKVLFRAMQNIAKIDNYSVYINTIDDTQEFWDLVDRKNVDEILEIKFEMVAPNFWGNTGQAKDLVDEAKKQINASEVSISLVNKKGKLRASMEYLDSFVKYTAYSGSWKVKVRKNGYIKTLKSDDTFLKKQVSENIIDSIKNISHNNSNNIDTYNNCIEEIEKLFVDRE